MIMIQKLTVLSVDVVNNLMLNTSGFALSQN